MKQTAVEWLSELIECGADLDQIKKCIPKAKEMEKGQIIDAYIEGHFHLDFNTYNPEKYYNKTFNPK